MAPSRLSIAFALALRLLSSAVGVQAQYPDPNDDPFYAVPANVANFGPGTVLKSRAVSTPQQTLNVAQSWQLLYRTTNQQGSATATVATLWVPQSPKSPPSILLYNAAEDSLNIDCAPSWGFVNNSASNFNNIEKNLQAPIIVPFAVSKGYYVVTTDAEGPTSAWLVGNVEGKAGLDGVRAAIKHKSLSNPRVAIYGYSGGARTSVWAASLAASYASELNVVGAAFGGTPVDLGAAYNTLDNTANSALGAGALFGLGNGYPNLNTTLTGLLSTTGRQVSSSLRRRNNCIPNAQNNAGVPQSIESLFTSGPRGNTVLENTLKQESLLSTVNPNTIPVPTFPRLQYHGNNDEIVPYQPEADYVSQQCARNAGAKIWFSTFYGFNHAATAVAGFLGALNFVANALDGQNVTPPSCGATTVTQIAPGSPGAQNLLGSALSNTLCSLCNCC